MRKSFSIFFSGIFSIFLSVSCQGGANAKTTTKTEVEERGNFSGDSAYGYVARQVEFGPRIPGTRAHAECTDWLLETLKANGADSVAVVGREVTLWDGKRVTVKNVFARYEGEDSEARPMILLAHYDTRPWADNDADASVHSQPIDGANDGASGVGVLLEISRNLNGNRPKVGVDFLFTDIEDYGTSDSQFSEEETWCVGSRQFAEDMDYAAYRWGILLDMVGGKDAVFPREYFSVSYAAEPTSKVWSMAEKLGLRGRFPMTIGGGITDDHLPFIRKGIPTTDIIESAHPATGSFPPTWHTLNDNLENIDRSTLEDVGRVVLNVIYNEK